MKAVSLILAAIVISFSLPACATSKKSDCCSGSSSCSAPDGKTTVKSHDHSHHGKKKSS